MIRLRRTGVSSDVASGSVPTIYITGRAVLGVTMLLAPGLVGRTWLGTAAAERSRWLVRAVGMRDVVVPVGYALDRSHRTAWVIAAAAADASDVLISIAFSIRRRRILTLAAVVPAAAGTVVGVAIARGRRPQTA